MKKILTLPASYSRFEVFQDLTTTERPGHEGLSRRPPDRAFAMLALERTSSRTGSKRGRWRK